MNAELHDALAPFRSLPKRIVKGTPVLAKMLLVGLVTSARIKGHQAPAVAVEDGEEEGQEQPAKAAPRGLLDRLEQFVMVLLVLAFVAGTLGMLWQMVTLFLAPYLGLVYAGGALVWCAFAAVVAPDDTPADDLENSGGEAPEDEETEESEAEWETRKAAFLAFVEQRTAAGAAGHLRAKGRGIPVDDLLLEMQDLGAATGWERKDMADFLDECGVRVRPQMKFTIGGRQKTPPGVHVLDLAEDLGRTPRIPAQFVPDLTPGFGDETTPDEAPAVVLDKGPAGAPTVVMD